MTVNLETYLEKNHNMVVGERTADEIRQKLTGISKGKIKISGRSYETGRKKAVHVRLVDLLGD